MEEEDGRRRPGVGEVVGVEEKEERMEWRRRRRE
jgi:hypothetical protein